jgi:hypothetical protein
VLIEATSSPFSKTDKFILYGSWLKRKREVVMKGSVRSH